MTEALSFKTPEEEIAYLRSRVEGLPERKQSVVEAIKDVHRELPVTIRHNNDVKESLERVGNAGAQGGLDELVNISRSKGVLHALSVLEKLEDWKHEDEFHSYLVDLVRKGIEPKGVGSRGPMYRALNMTLFEVVIPEGERNDGDSLKTLVSGMESFYSGMISISEKKNIGKNYFVIEVANSDGDEEANFFVSVPSEKKSLFEKQLRGVFPNAEIVERERDYNIFSENSYSVGSTAKLEAPSAFPIKTYEAFDHDPLNAILQSFSKIPKDGAGASIQIVVNPKGTVYTSRYANALGKIQGGMKAWDAVAERTLLQDFMRVLGSLFITKKKKKDGEVVTVDTQAVELLQKKLLSPTVATNIRIAVSAPNKAEAESLLTEMESSFNQLELPGVNRISWVKAKGAKFFRDFTFRMYKDKGALPLNLRELTTLMHFHTTSLAGKTQLKQSKAMEAQAPVSVTARSADNLGSNNSTLLGINNFQGQAKNIYITPEDRLRHLYVIGQTGTGKSTLLKNIIVQDIKAGEGVCMIDPHGADVLDVLASIPPERMADVIYFDPASTERPIALNMLECDPSRPEEKTFVVNELFNIFQKLYGKVPESMGPMFEQYFRNATMLVIEDPSTGATLLDVSRVLSNKEFRDLKLSKCSNPVVLQFWREVALKAGGEAALANIVPYITSKFDVFLANDIMRPIIAQEKSSMNFRKIMDSKKILLVNLSKGRLGEVNANLIGLILVGKILMSALSRGGGEYPTFYLHIDEFQNVTTDSIATILSEARKYKLSLTVAHQFIAQLEEGIKNAVFGNVGSMISFRVGADDAEYLEKQFTPVFSAKDLMNIDNRHAYVKMLMNGKPEKPFSLETLPPPQGNPHNVDSLIEMTKLKYGRNREDVEKEILAKYGH